MTEKQKIASEKSAILFLFFTRPIILQIKLEIISIKYKLKSHRINNITKMKKFNINITFNQSILMILTPFIDKKMFLFLPIPL